MIVGSGKQPMIGKTQPAQSGPRLKASASMAAARFAFGTPPPELHDQAPLIVVVGIANQPLDVLHARSSCNVDTDPAECGRDTAEIALDAAINATTKVRIIMLGVSGLHPTTEGNPATSTGVAVVVPPPYRAQAKEQARPVEKVAAREALQAPDPAASVAPAWGMGSAPLRLVPAPGLDTRQRQAPPAEPCTPGAARRAARRL